MKMTKKFFALLFIGSALVACNNNGNDSTAVEANEAEEVKQETTEAMRYAVSEAGNEILWEGYKTYNIGDAHQGSIKVAQGNFMIEGNDLVGGNFTIDMTSIENFDLAENEEDQQKLVGHLKSPDFFAVDSFPTAKFEITEVMPASNDTTGATHHVKGNLTLRGVTKNITIPAMVQMDGNSIMFQTPEFVIDRSKWNVKFRSTSFTQFADIAKDKVIDNNIKLQVKLKANKA